MSAPFKMKGFSGYGNSPLKQTATSPAIVDDPSIISSSTETTRKGNKKKTVLVRKGDEGKGRKTISTTYSKKTGHPKKKIVTQGGRTSTYKYEKGSKGAGAVGVKKSKEVTKSKGTKTTTRTNWRTGKETTRVDKPGFQISDIWGGKKVRK